jgi:hypothetical protein
VPFRLLGVVADPSQAADLCGHAFAHYAASGTDVTLVCVGARDWRREDQLPAVRRLGVRDLVLLDYNPRELTSPAFEDLLADVIASVRPHVVVADGSPAVNDAASSAFSRVRRAAGGSLALPAKFYYRPSSSSPLVSVTTSIAVGSGASPELFVRVFPDPWVTGVLERDLFAGVPADAPARASLDEQLAG